MLLPHLRVSALPRGVHVGPYFRYESERVQEVPLFNVVEVASEDFEILEQLGTKTKFWYDGYNHLFKEGRPGSGENWSEVVCAKIACALGLPHAKYELAETDIPLAGAGITQGTTTPNFIPSGGRLALGNELIVNVSSDAKAQAQNRRRQHTVTRIYAYLGIKRVLLPLGWLPPAQVKTAAGVMSGYLLLDALIGNQDRHEENWGVIFSDGSAYLAPTFDHASSLGRNETDAKRTIKLAERDPRFGIEAYVSKAMSQIYGRNEVRLSTIDAFASFSSYCRKEGEYWQAQLSRIPELTFRIVLDEVPDSWITAPAREFAVQMLMENRKRILQVRL